jgi:hypothetical protein
MLHHALSQSLVDYFDGVLKGLKVCGATQFFQCIEQISICLNYVVVRREASKSPLHCRWLIRLRSPEDHKTGESHGSRPDLILFPFLYQELEAFENTWRKYLKPKDDFFFSKKNGKKWDASGLRSMFTTTAFR